MSGVGQRESTLLGNLNLYQQGTPEGLCRREDASALCNLHRIKRHLTFLCLPMPLNLFTLLPDIRQTRVCWRIRWQRSEQAQLAGPLSQRHREGDRPVCFYSGHSEMSFSLPWSHMPFHRHSQPGKGSTLTHPVIIAGLQVLPQSRESQAV